MKEYLKNNPDIIVLIVGFVVMFVDTWLTNYGKVITQISDLSVITRLVMFVCIITLMLRVIAVVSNTIQFYYTKFKKVKSKKKVKTKTINKNVLFNESKESS